MSNRPLVKTFQFLAKVDAEVFAAEKRAEGVEAWVVYNCAGGRFVDQGGAGRCKGGRFVVTVRSRRQLDSNQNNISGSCAGLD